MLRDPEMRINIVSCEGTGEIPTLGMKIRKLRSLCKAFKKSQFFLPLENASNPYPRVTKWPRALNISFRNGLCRGLSAGEVYKADQLLNITLGSFKDLNILRVKTCWCQLFKSEEVPTPTSMFGSLLPFLHRVTLAPWSHQASAAAFLPCSLCIIPKISEQSQPVSRVWVIRFSQQIQQQCKQQTRPETPELSPLSPRFMPLFCPEFLNSFKADASSAVLQQSRYNPLP